MKVADLQQHLTDLERFLTNAGAARTIVADLAEIARGLAPFRELSLKEFAGFLVRAEAYSRGDVPLKPPEGGRSAPRKGSGHAPPENATVLTREVGDLYGRAADASVTTEHIETVAGRLAGLSKNELLAIADGIELKGMKSRTKADILGAIRQRLLARKGTAQRVGLIDRVSADHPDPAPVAPTQ